MRPIEQNEWYQRHAVGQPYLEYAKQTGFCGRKEKESEREQRRQYTPAEITIRNHRKTAGDHRNVLPPPRVFRMNVVGGKQENDNCESRKMRIPDQSADFEQPRRQQRGTGNDYADRTL